MIVWLSYRSLAGLGPIRRWIAIGLRCTLLLLLTMALAEVRIRHQNENVTVLFLVDRSLSIPEEFDPELPPVRRRADAVDREPGVPRPRHGDVELDDREVTPLRARGPHGLARSSGRSRLLAPIMPDGPPG